MLLFPIGFRYVWYLCSWLLIMFFLRYTAIYLCFMVSDRTRENAVLVVARHQNSVFGAHGLLRCRDGCRRETHGGSEREHRETSRGSDGAVAYRFGATDEGYAAEEVLGESGPLYRSRQGDSVGNGQKGSNTSR